MISSKAEACHILGLPSNATISEIKAAYRDLAKIYHPDSGINSNPETFNEINEAYEIAVGNITFNFPNITPSETNVKPKQHHSDFRSTASSKDYAAFEKQMQKQRKERLKDLEEKSKILREKKEKEDAEYKRAMEAIDAIRVATAIEAMVKANAMEKDSE